MSQVAVLTPSFPRYPDDYHGVFIKDLCDRLSKHVSIKVIAPRTRTLRAINTMYSVHRFPYLPLQQMEYIAEETMKNAPMINIACLPAYLFSAYLQIIQTRAKLIHTHLALPLGTIAAYNPRKTPQLLTCHGSDITYPIERPVYQPVIRKTLQKADHIVTVSNYIREKAIQLGANPQKTETIYLGVDTDHFKPRKRERNLTIGTLGRLVREKNIDELFYAAKQLQPKLDFHLKIGGDGPDQDRLKKLASSLGLDVEFAGRVKDNVGFHQSLDVFILTSRREGLSISLQEAMSCGTSPVAVEGYSSNEIIQDKVNGYLYPPGNYKTLATTIIQAMENKHTQKQARKTIINKFNKQNATNEYLRVYHEMGIS